MMIHHPRRGRRWILLRSWKDYRNPMSRLKQGRRSSASSSSRATRSRRRSSGATSSSRTTTIPTLLDAATSNHMSDRGAALSESMSRLKQLSSTSATRSMPENEELDNDEPINPTANHNRDNITFLSQEWTHTKRVNESLAIHG